MSGLCVRCLYRIFDLDVLKRYAGMTQGTNERQKQVKM